MTLVAHWQSPEVAQPSKQTLNFPATSVATQFATVLGLCFASVSAMWGNQLNALLRQSLVQWVAVIGSVTDQALRFLSDEGALQRRLNQGYFMRASTCDAYGERKTSAVCHCHDLRTFAPLGLSHPWPPFLATTKVPSIKHSLRSRSPRSLRSWASSWRMRSMTPSATHFWNRRWQVWYGGYRSGRSCQGAPVRRIHSTPSSTPRGSCQGRPRRGSLARSSSGISGSMIAHCSSVRSIAHLGFGDERNSTIVSDL
jgi:hypothetical protein